MASYQVLVQCRLCKKRQVVDKSRSRMRYCASCQERINKQREKESE